MLKSVWKYFSKKNQSFTFDEIRIQVFQNVSVIWNDLSDNLISFVLFLKVIVLRPLAVFADELRRLCLTGF